MTSINQVARLINACEVIEGRVKLQKIVHILQEAGYPFDQEFGYLHHGPYSSELRHEIDQLVSWKLVNEASGPVIEYTQYVYSPADSLPDILEEIGEDEVPEWAELAKQLNRKSSAELEAISTTLYLMRKGFKDEALSQRFAELKPHLSGRFKDCLKQAKRLRDAKQIKV